MQNALRKKRIQVLNSLQTRHWHSPFNSYLRECRQARIIEKCKNLARRAGFAEFAIYDAFETLVARGSVSD